VRPFLRQVVGRPVARRPACTPEWWPSPPLPPHESNYSSLIPTVNGTTVVRVTDSSGLVTALLSTPAKDIVVAPGAYSNAGSVTFGAAHKVWCESVSGCTFDFGVIFRFSANQAWRGGTFVVSDAANGAQIGSGNKSCLGIGSDASADRNLVCTDVVFDGQGVLGWAYKLGSVGGSKTQRLLVKGRFLDQGVRVNDQNAASVRVADVVSDLNVSGVYRSVRGEADGSAEQGCDFGNKVTNGVSRVRIRDCGWAGVFTGNNIRDTTIASFDIDNCWALIPVGSTESTSPGQLQGGGFRVNHQTRNCVIERFRIGVTGDMIRGITNEWDDDRNWLLAASASSGATQIQLDFNGNANDVTKLPSSGTLYFGTDYLTAVAVAYSAVDRAALTVQANAGTSVLTFASVPAGWTAGTSLRIGSSSAETRTIQSTTSTTVTLTANLSTTRAIGVLVNTGLVTTSALPQTFSVGELVSPTAGGNQAATRNVYRRGTIDCNSKSSPSRFSSAPVRPLRLVGIGEGTRDVLVHDVVLRHSDEYVIQDASNTPRATSQGQSLVTTRRVNAACNGAALNRYIFST
jgi:hypothetical protein